MDNQDIQKRRGRYSNTLTGVLLLGIGGVLLLYQTGYPMPDWLFTWPMILILLGLFSGTRSGFRDFGWLIFILIGFIFLAEDIWPGFRIKQYALPVIIIFLGLIFLLVPKKMCKGGHRHRCGPPRLRQPMQVGALPLPAEPVTEADVSMETTLDITSIFGGINKKVLSKQFQGGDVVCVFGGAEINLSNADFRSPITIDLVNIFGGTKIIVPANWEIRSEVTTIFGGIDDKRQQAPNTVAEKTIILQGTLLFGGVEISSF